MRQGSRAAIRRCRCSDRGSSCRGTYAPDDGLLRHELLLGEEAEEEVGVVDHSSFDAEVWYSFFERVEAVRTGGDDRLHPALLLVAV
jgi:hypothetical protein